MGEQAKGILALIAACTVWGLSPLYYKLLVTVPPLELLAHRTLWSLVFFAGLLALQGRLGRLWAVLRDGGLVARLALAAAMVSLNWFGFILSVQVGRTTEASLGYYIYPLVAVLLGRVVLGERLSRGQAAAIALAAAAVLVLTAGLGVAPWLSLMLASSFGVYTLIKKRLAVGPVVSVTAEVALMAPLAGLWLGWAMPGPGVFGQEAGVSLLLVLSGVLTALPLILFSYASQRVSMAALGLGQYLNPTLQFLCAVVVFGEAFGLVHAVAFALIWSAVALFSAVQIAQDRARRRAATAAGTSGTV